MLVFHGIYTAQSLLLTEILCLQLYIPWNFHERSPGTFKWDGEADVERFLDICHSLGLNVRLCQACGSLGTSATCC